MCQDFQAVPGYGISCRVSAVDHLLLPPGGDHCLLPGVTTEESSVVEVALKAPPQGRSTHLVR